MFIIHIFLSSHKYCDCCGNGNSQNVAAVGDLCVADNTCACFSFFCCHLNFFKIIFFKKFFQEHYQSLKSFDPVQN